MLPSSTVENYLKAIYLAESALDAASLVPMGQLAVALDVVPGTATTMVKTLEKAEAEALDGTPLRHVQPGPQ